jgi:outer membrane protein assembly factor BamB
LAQRGRVIGAVICLLLLGIVLSSCTGATPTAENWPGLTVAGENVYVISGTPQQVYLVDAKAGTQKATFVPQDQSKGVFYWSPVTVGGDLAFVGFADSASQTAGLYAFDLNTGLEQWSFPGDDVIIPAPAYADGVVYFGDSDGRVYAVDVETRSVKPGWPFQAKEAIWASPLVAGGRVYVASMDHHLYCLDAETGGKLWDAEVGGAMAAQPTLDAAQGILYVGAFDGRVYAIRADSGDRVEGFQFQAEGWIWSEVLVAGDRLYVTSLNGKLYALDPATGQVIAPYPYDSAQLNNGTKDSIRAAPVQAGDSIVVVTESGRVIAVQNGLGRQLWSSGTPSSPIYTPPVVAEGTIYVVLRDGTVQTLNAETGAPGWSFPSPQSQ